MEPSTSEETPPAPSSLNTAFIKRLKIAVATAIIRNKPSNSSAKEYTETLAKRFRLNEENWRGRIRRLENELLKTKQELAVSRLQDAGVCVQFGEWSIAEGECFITLAVLSWPTCMWLELGVLGVFPVIKIIVCQVCVYKCISIQSLSIHILVCIFLSMLKV